MQQVLRDEGRCTKVRATADASALYAIVVEDLASDAA
jgi:hypothetical protein